LKVIIKGDHTVDGAIVASLKDPSGTEVAADTGLGMALKVELPVEGEWTLDLSLEGVDAAYTGTWCAGCA
jgi:hypothetical protein